MDFTTTLANAVHGCGGDLAGMQVDGTRASQLATLQGCVGQDIRFHPRFVQGHQQVDWDAWNQALKAFQPGSFVGGNFQVFERPRVVA